MFLKGQSAPATRKVMTLGYQCGNKSCNYFFTVDYVEWLGHLASPGHSLLKLDQVPGQTPSRSLEKHFNNLEEICQWILIRRIQVSVTNLSILSYFSRWGSIVDFKRLDDYQAILKYKSEENVLDVILVTAEKSLTHEVEGVEVHVYQMSHSLCRQMLEDNPNPINHTLPSLSNVTSNSSQLSTQITSNLASGLSLKVEVPMLIAEVKKIVTLEKASILNIFHSQWAENLYKKIISKSIKLEDQLDYFMKQVLLSNEETLERISITIKLFDFLKDKHKRCKDVLSIFPCGMDYLSIAFSQDPLDFFIDFDGWLGCPIGSLNEKLLDRMWKDLIPKLQLKVYTTEIPPDLKAFQQKISEIKTLSSSGIERISLNFHQKTKKVQNIKLPQKLSIRIQKEDFPSVQIIRLAKFYSSLDPRVRPLLLIIRYWIFFHEIFDSLEKEERNLISVLLVLFFLIRKKILPDLFQLQNMTKDEDKIYLKGNIEVSFCTDVKLIFEKNKNDSMSLGLLKDKLIWTHSSLQLLKEFFKELSNVDLVSKVICVASGEFLNKKSFQNSFQSDLDLADELKKRFLSQKLAKIAIEEESAGIIAKKMEFFNGCFCIQHPFELTRNVAGGLSVGSNSLDVDQFQFLAGVAYKRMEELLESDTPNFMNVFVDKDSVKGRIELDVNDLRLDVEIGIPPSVDNWEKCCSLSRRQKVLASCVPYHPVRLNTIEKSIALPGTSQPNAVDSNVKDDASPTPTVEMSQEEREAKRLQNFLKRRERREKFKLENEELRKQGKPLKKKASKGKKWKERLKTRIALGLPFGQATNPNRFPPK